MNAPRAIELLAPARDLACGIAAINHGADAVYIGGPRFSARAAAANSLADIEHLVRYAHQFRARVYIALNTLFSDDELEQAVELCHHLYELGADALILQDVGLLETDLPPIALHSSTQMNNRTVEKVRFLERVGFAQVVLARELSLAQIRQIHAATTVPLECFVHGSLCVCYSGQCYISEVVAGRSANRGQCAQFCRHRYDLRDGNGKVLVKDRYLLSLKDLDLSRHLASLIDAGIRSLKIEGRLKDEQYVKNVTATYRLALDAIIEGRTDLERASSGRCRFSFAPDPARSFSRGATDLFLKHSKNRPAEIRSPKSIGKKLGRVLSLDANSFMLDGNEPVHNGDGLCFFNDNNELVGVRVNRVEGRTIFPHDGVAHLKLSLGTELFRNADARFTKLLDQSQRCRTILVDLTLLETADGLQLTCLDEDHIASTTTIRVIKEEAKKAGSLAALAERQLTKTGETIFSTGTIGIELSDTLHIPAAVLNDLRRQALAHHTSTRLKAYRREIHQLIASDCPWPAGTVDYRDNVTNSRAAAFYRRHGVQRLDPAKLRPGMVDDCALMTTKYCIRAQLGICPQMPLQRAVPAEPLFLTDRTGSYEVEFHCERCEMTLRRKR